MVHALHNPYRSLSLFSAVVLSALYLTLIPAPSSAQAGAIYYVSPAGSDQNDGRSLATPFRTIQKCASVAQAGDTCSIRAGVYRETVRPANSGAAGRPITFAAYADETVVISGADPIGGWSP
jgi:hypothetical protein